jgi:hypothetical protein
MRWYKNLFQVKHCDYKIAVGLNAADRNTRSMAEILGRVILVSKADS